MKQVRGVHDFGILLGIKPTFAITGWLVFGKFGRCRHLCFFCVWIASGWAGGAAAVSVGAIGCCFFAALDEPVPMMLTFLRWGVTISAFYLFIVLSTGQDFVVLVIFFAFVFVPLRLLMVRPKRALVSTLVALTTATFLGICDAYDANFPTFTNGNRAGLAGVIFASILTGVVRPFDASAALGRLTRSI